ncbi:zinc ABC transporter substrate-binding protein [Thalassospira lohafexi]|uniref:High-affinity zinc uptake system protein ZnuA n=1 Tax=Thalassospira lohafexi TaxID=744227 RepID=A0A2N3L306_9PROT|nr:zinc ABC transporter substrate-binding protein [Thalassospira lohafexi]PKR57204.1 zinc ABC transporter substrate-binding protein [Thalassospira lohafexi]
MQNFPSTLRRLLLASPLLVAPFAAQAADAPSVVATLKPIHGITSALMDGVGEPTLLIDGAASPHAYSLRPSEARALQNADLVIYVSHSLESFLEKPLATLSVNSHQLELIDAPGLTLRDMREGGSWEAHSHDHGAHEDHEEHGESDHDHDHEVDHEHDHDAHDHEADHEHEHADGHDHDHDADEHHHDEHEHEHGGINPHIWLDPVNGAAIATAIADELIEIDAAHAENYRENLKKLLASLTVLGNDLGDKLAPVRSTPYVVFHDAYQYLEAGFGLNGVGSVTVSPEQKPGAKRLHEIEEKIRDTGAVCVFAEPQFRPAIVKAIVADTGARIGTLDPLGANIPKGPDAYQAILAQNVDALVDCLGNGS